MTLKRGLLVLVSLLVLSLALVGCAEEEVQAPGQDSQPSEEQVSLEGKLAPEEWADAYPEIFETYLLTAEGGSDHSKYRGSDHFDRNSAWPFQWIMYEGWGMGIEYTESRGHYYATIDQLDIAPQRRGAGGACLTCKNPMVPELIEEMGEDYFRLPYDEVHAQIPVEYQKVGVACIDCHDPGTMDLRISREHTLMTALGEMDNVPEEFTDRQMGMLTCAQCHTTYSIPKNEDGESIDVIFPWFEAEWEAITIEAVEKQIMEQELYEFTNTPTGVTQGHIRHPEFEFYAMKGNVHYELGLTCVDCHMPMTEVDGKEFRTHQWTSPFKLDNELAQCMTCHSNYTPEEKKERVFEVQDGVNELFTEAGFIAAQAARAIEMANNTDGVDEELLDEAKEAYERSYYRIVWIGAENSMGFHNSPEAYRVLNDGLEFAQTAEAKARQAIIDAGGTPPEVFDLRLEDYPYDPAENRAHDGREQ